MVLAEYFQSFNLQYQQTAANLVQAPENQGIYNIDPQSIVKVRRNNILGIRFVYSQL
jgi:hypothetical protein